MIDQIENQEIEVSVFLLGFTYASPSLTLVVWFAGQAGI